MTPVQFTALIHIIVFFLPPFFHSSYPIFLLPFETLLPPLLGVCVNASIRLGVGGMTRRGGKVPPPASGRYTGARPHAHTEWARHDSARNPRFERHWPAARTPHCCGGGRTSGLFTNGPPHVCGEQWRRCVRRPELSGRQEDRHGVPCFSCLLKRNNAVDQGVSPDRRREPTRVSTGHGRVVWVRRSRNTEERATRTTTQLSQTTLETQLRLPGCHAIAQKMRGAAGQEQTRPPHAESAFACGRSFVPKFTTGGWEWSVVFRPDYRVSACRLALGSSCASLPPRRSRAANPRQLRTPSNTANRRKT